MKALGWTKSGRFLRDSKGMSITLKHLFRKPVTFNYPNQKRHQSVPSRNSPLQRHEDGLERCVGAVSARWSVHRTPFIWKRRKTHPSIGYLTVNATRNTIRSICCAASSAVSAKRHVPRMPLSRDQTGKPPAPIGRIYLHQGTTAAFGGGSGQNPLTWLAQGTGSRHPSRFLRPPRILSVSGNKGGKSRHHKIKHRSHHKVKRGVKYHIQHLKPKASVKLEHQHGASGKFKHRLKP